MTAREIRQTFLSFFESKQHKIVPSAPIVNKDDPTLLFTNAGMNQFKDYFLGTQVPVSRRVADTQKCLRVSGKHNDLEEVGRDGYHHTMFEMLGNWSFGDYFKREAIEWSWELLTQVYGLPADRLYATVFEGSAADGLAADTEALAFWKQWLPETHILFGNKKDNFWEMGDTGPCGPCSEIHIDLRSEAERNRIPGATLVNTGDPLVVEIWNNVFIQFNRKADGSLQELPDKHVDTGMGFERLAMAIQGKTATYDTDIFTPLLLFIENETGIRYRGWYPATMEEIPDPEGMSDIAMRVVADHIRAVAFTIADGQLPGNSGAGYVIRRILRRAVRYYYSFLHIREPFLCRIIPLLSDLYDGVFPELKAQAQQVANIIRGEEKAFLHTLENGLRRFADLPVHQDTIAGADAFELYDTFGFPIDLTRLMAAEKGWQVDEAGFQLAMQAQKERARAAAAKETGDWQVLRQGEDVLFLGYDQLEVEDARILRYRTVKTNKESHFHLVLNRTPFYAESGGQHGDAGTLTVGAETIRVLDTKKENELVVHVVDRFPEDLTAPVTASVDVLRRQQVCCNHSAAHLLHAALHQVLGAHALQKGQDVDDSRLRFDFSHFQKPSDDELRRLEELVNHKIRANIPLQEHREVPIADAREMGAMMLFGEKYGEQVRIITFDPDFSRELCGGTHVRATGEIGLFRIVSESAVAAGIRRIEAVTAAGADAFLRERLDTLADIRQLLKGAQDPLKALQSLQEELKGLKKQVEQLTAAQTQAIKAELKERAESVNGIRLVAAVVPLQDSNALKSLAFQLEQELDRACIVLGAVVDGKPLLMVAVSKELTGADHGVHAGQIVRELAKEIQGGGGGQPFFASAGGKDPDGLPRAVRKAADLLAG